MRKHCLKLPHLFFENRTISAYHVGTSSPTHPEDILVIASVGSTGSSGGLNSSLLSTEANTNRATAMLPFPSRRSMEPCTSIVDACKPNSLWSLWRGPSSECFFWEINIYLPYFFENCSSTENRYALEQMPAAFCVHIASVAAS